MNRGYLELAWLFSYAIPGGTLPNSEGLVVGLVVAKLDEIETAKETGSLQPQNVNYVLKSTFVLSFLKELADLSGKLSPAKKGSLDWTQIVKKVSRSVVVILCY
jgi:hypothetical protein